VQQFMLVSTAAWLESRAEQEMMEQMMEQMMERMEARGHG
jgi:hypothetical protein